MALKIRQIGLMPLYRDNAKGALRQLDAVDAWRNVLQEVH